MNCARAEPTRRIHNLSLGGCAIWQSPKLFHLIGGIGIPPEPAAFANSLPPGFPGSSPIAHLPQPFHFQAFQFGRNRVKVAFWDRLIPLLVIAIDITDAGAPVAIFSLS